MPSAGVLGVGKPALVNLLPLAPTGAGGINSDPIWGQVTADIRRRHPPRMPYR